MGRTSQNGVADRSPTMSTATRIDEEVISALAASLPLVAIDESDTRQVRLTQRADEEGLLDVAYPVVDSPIGPMLLAASAAGLVRVAFEREDHDVVLAQLAVTIGPRILRSGRRTDNVARQLDEYFVGRRRILRSEAIE